MTINIEATIRWKGYNPNDLSAGSDKRVWVNCDECGKGRWGQLKDYNKNLKYLCKSCSTKGANNPMYSKHHSGKTRKKMSEAASGEKNYWYGKHRSDKTCKKMSEAQIGKHPSKETREKISKAHTGKHLTAEHRTKIGRANTGKYHSKESKRNMSKAHMGIRPSEETRKKLREINIGKHLSKETRKKISEANTGEKNCFHGVTGNKHPAYGRHHSDETRNKISKAQIGKIISEESRKKLSATCQGIPYDEWECFAKEQPYCPAFNEACRESNREKYSRRCFICGLPESENRTKTGKIRKLSVHHIDMNKQQGCDGNRWKLIPTCISHHSMVHNDLWKDRIMYLLNTCWN